ncbi:hypothetical protein [Rossellomorea sp. NRS-1567]|uniref:hypothetical protein n=1 Tax=Rossellomorea sp. NRS-1567 TaxID=3233901 RepID=UPI003D283305
MINTSMFFRIVVVLILGVGLGVAVTALDAINSVALIMIFNLFVLRINDKYKYPIVFFIILVILLNNNIIQFPLFPQAEILLGSNPISLLHDHHPHALRYLVAFPAIAASEYFKISIDVVYSIYILLMFSCTFWLFILIQKEIIATNYAVNLRVNYLLPLIVLFVLTITMNGRLVPAYLGFALILLLQIKMYSSYSYNIREYFFHLLICLAWLLTTVSSGTMFVALIQIFIGYIFILIKKFRYIFLIFGSFTLFVFLDLIKDFLIRSFFKNLNFFGDDYTAILNMTSHGIIRLFEDYLILKSLVIIIVIFLGLSIYSRIKKISGIKILLIAVCLSLIGGSFGISTGTMIIVPLTIVGTFQLGLLNKKEDY